MQGDARVIEYLNRGLRHELAAINQYWLHYRLLDNWGYRALAKKWRKESIEEMQHADKLTTRIIFLDGFPNMQVIDPLHIGQTVKEVLDSDLGAELSARELYQEASTYYHSVKDYVSRDLFEELMADEEDHIDFLETQLDLVAKLDAVSITILLGAVLVLAGILSSLIALRFGAPLLLLFLIIGMAAGESGPGGIRFDDVHLAYTVGSIALALILF